MPYPSVPQTELAYLLDVEHALAEVAKPPPSLAPPGAREAASMEHALTALERAGMRSGRRESLVRALRVIGIRRPGRFVLGLCSDYRQASWVRTAEGDFNPGYLAADDFESVALLLQTILFYRPDMARLELNAAAILLADKWLEASGHELPAEGPPVLHVAAFHSGGLASERADALRQLATWALTSRSQAESRAGDIESRQREAVTESPSAPSLVDPVPPAAPNEASG